MKNIKKLLALVLVLVMALSITACHPKDEVALSLGDYKITSAVYLTALISAEQDAKNRAYENASAMGITLSTDEDYYGQAIDGKDFKDYVKDTALELCKQYLALDKLLAEGKYKLSDEVKAGADQIANDYWNNYGLNVLYEANGISFETYKKTVIYSQMASEYFVSLYGEGGSKAVSKDEIVKAINSNYVLAYVLQGSYSSSMTDTEKTALKKEFAGYKTDIEAGKKTFKEIYVAYNKITDEVLKEAEKGEAGVDRPSDVFATIIGGSKTSNPNENFAAIYTMKKDEMKLLETDSGYNLVIRLDILEDGYYTKQLTEEILGILKNEEHTKEIEAYTAALEVKVNNFAIDRFKVEDIVTTSDLQTLY